MAESEFVWTQDTWGPDAEAPGRRASSRNEKLAWFGVIAVVVVAFELTADPALSTGLGCLKFGWDEIRLARWLKRTDPVRKRGRVCSQFYLAWGLWRISLVAAAMMFIIVFAHGAIGGNPGRARGLGAPPPGFISSFFLAMVGFLLSSAVSSLAVFSALRHRVRVWVGPEVHWAREEQVWPPQAVARRRPTSNRTKAILLSALITASTFGGMVLLLPISFLISRNFESPILSFAFMMLSMIGVPILILAFLDQVGTRMIAPTPEMCWTDAGGNFHP
jgi:hypothetical protein